MFHLAEDWKWIAKKAWSFRLTILAAALSFFEVYFSFVDPYSLPAWLPPGSFAVLAGLTSVVANIARIVAQRKEPNSNADQ